MSKLGWRAFQVRQLMRARIRVAVILLAFCGCAFLHAEKISDIHPRGYVTDLADVIEPNTEQRIDLLCTEVDQKTGAQIAVVTVRSLEGLTRQEYGVELFKHLGVGSKKDDRGVLLLLAPPERQYWIEVGYGLEPVINDARAGDIGRSMVPALRQNQYSAAIESAVTQLAQLIAADRGVTLDAAPQPVAAPSEGAPGLPWWTPLVIFFGIFLLLRLLAGSGRRRRRWPGFWWIGPGGWGGGGWGGGGFGGSSGGWGGGGGFGGFGGGSSGGGGAGGSW